MLMLSEGPAVFDILVSSGAIWRPSFLLNLISDSVWLLKSCKLNKGIWLVNREQTLVNSPQPSKSRKGLWCARPTNRISNIAEARWPVLLCFSFITEHQLYFMYHPPKSSLSNKHNWVFAFLHSVNTHTHTRARASSYAARHNCI